MSTADYDKLARLARKKRLMEPGSGTPVSYDAAAVEKLLPHRPPFRFVDGIDAVDLAGKLVAGHFTPRADNPVFAGHFPEYPVWPGMLQLEAIGQLSICLEWFLRRATSTIAEDAKPLDVRALKVHHAQFLGEVRPDARCTLIAHSLSADDFGGVFAGQFIVGDKICAVAIGEVYFPG